MYTGPRSPSQPTSVQFINTTHNTATVEWRIREITYTPESYYVEYGTDPTSLTQRSSTIPSGSDLTATNQLYSVVISGLLSNTTYHYRVVAGNTFSSTRSSLNSFLTISLRKLAICIISLLSMYLEESVYIL